MTYIKASSFLFNWVLYTTIPVATAITSSRDSEKTFGFRNVSKTDETRVNAIVCGTISFVSSHVSHVKQFICQASRKHTYII